MEAKPKNSPDACDPIFNGKETVSTTRDVRDVELDG